MLEGEMQLLSKWDLKGSNSSDKLNLNIKAIQVFLFC